MRAKKSFGQHFLTNEDIASRIADALALPDTLPARVLEIGPGKGMLTQFLLPKNFILKVVEADKDMVAILKNRFPTLQQDIIAADFLKLDLSTVFTGNAQDESKNDQENIYPPVQFCIIGNFPYNISSQIVFKMLEYRQHVFAMTGMFQKEMAARIIATPGSKDYGVISVLTQAFYAGEYLFTVGNRNFNPPPKVTSGVIRLVRKSTSPACDEMLFKKVVKQAFQQRRKMLRNSMKPFFKDTTLLNSSFFTQRPEMLSLSDFVELTQIVENELNKPS